MVGLYIVLLLFIGIQLTSPPFHFSLVTPEIADRLKAKKMEEVAPIPKIELDVSFDGEQIMDDFGKKKLHSEIIKKLFLFYYN